MIAAAVKRIVGRTRDAAPTSDTRFEPLGIQPGTAFTMLSNQRRRLVVEKLFALDEGETTDINTLSRYVARHELGVEDHELRSDDRKRVYVSLYQAHMEKLDDAGIVDWNDRSQEVAPGPELDAVMELYQTASAQHATHVAGDER